MHVIATAGHVDHGKSTLVRALTGMEPDRWAEERRRGMTIDLGYAWLTLPAGPDGQPGQTLAFVDVPGHERFVSNMLAGLGPVPAVMFVVAADGGWMPQSAEHLAAAHALGVRHGILVITRSDLADPAPAAARARAEIARTSLGAVEPVPVSAVTGAGMDELRAALTRLAASLPVAASLAAPAAPRAGSPAPRAGTSAPRAESPPPRAGSSAPGAGSSEISGAGAPDISEISTYRNQSPPVRLWIDRSFTIRGAGTVVTGTLPAGTIGNGSELLLTPSGRPVRIRGLEALGEPADTVTGVARVALNLRGVPAGLPERGMALVEPERWTLTSEVDLRVSPPAAGQPPKFPPALQLHVGSARTQARVRVLGTAPRQPAADEPAADDPAADDPAADEPAADEPADDCYLRVRLAVPLPLHAGDRVVLRDPGAAGLAIYGGRVLDPFPPPLTRRGAAAAATAELSGWPDPPGAADLLRRHKLLRAAQLTAAGVADGPEPVAAGWVADPAHWAWLRAELRAAVAAFCAKDPLAPGMPAEAARAALGLPDRDLVPALAAGNVPLEGAYLRVSAKRAPAATERAAGPAGQLPPRIAAAVDTLLDGFAADQFTAPDAERLAALGLDARALAAAARVGLLLRVADQVVLAPGADQEAARILAGLPQPFTTSQARQALGTTRRVAIPLLEYLDRARVTERLPGDQRRIRP